VVLDMSCVVKSKIDKGELTQVSLSINGAAVVMMNVASLGHQGEELVQGRNVWATAPFPISTRDSIEVALSGFQIGVRHYVSARRKYVN
jgi:hypothetical protein